MVGIGSLGMISPFQWYIWIDIVLSGMSLFSALPRLTFLGKMDHLRTSLGKVHLGFNVSSERRLFYQQLI